MMGLFPTPYSLGKVPCWSEQQVLMGAPSHVAWPLTPVCLLPRCPTETVVSWLCGLSPPLGSTELERQEA